jgi:hypothetical protein
LVGKGELNTCSSEKVLGVVCAELCAEQGNGEQHSDRMQEHNKAEGLRIPIAAEYVKLGRIDNCAVSLPQVTIPATTPLSACSDSG